MHIILDRLLTFTLVVGIFLVFIATLPAGADPVVPGEEHCVVNVRADDVLNVREQPGASAPIIGGKRYGDCGIIVHQCTGSWCAASNGHIQGYVHRHYIAMVSPYLYCVANVAPGDKLNLRAYPSAQSRILTRLDPNQCNIAFLPYATGGWQKIRVGGWQGWVNRSYVSGQ